MGINKIAKKIKYYKDKKVMWLLLLWVATFTFILAILLSLTFKLALIYSSLLYLVFAIGLFMLTAITRVKVAYFDMYHRYYLLLNCANPPVATKQLFDQNWLTKITKDDFILYYQSDSFDIYYKISPNLTRKNFAHNILECLAIIKSKQINLHHELLDKKYSEILSTNFKKEKINQQIIYQFKTYPEYTKDIKNELDQVIIFKQKKQCLIKINCGIFLKQNLVYYLNSNKYSPNIYYKYAVDELKALTS